MKNNPALNGLTRVYFDANSLIYYVEGAVAFQNKMAALFQYLMETEAQFITNELAVAECLYGAYRDKRLDLEQSYRKLVFDTGAFEVAPIDFALLDRAAKTGAELGLKLIDATHVCSAIAFDCEAIVTNDRGFKTSSGLRIIKVSDL